MADPCASWNTIVGIIVIVLFLGCTEDGMSSSVTSTPSSSTPTTPSALGEEGEGGINRGRGGS